MPALTSIRFIRLSMALVAIIGLSSCVAYRQPHSSVYVGPAATVVDYDYWYYPDVQVYFDINRGIYFYYSNHRWIQTRTLPAPWRSRLHGYVRIKSRHQRPYLDYNEHQRRYPPHYREIERHDRRDFQENRYEHRDKQPRIIQTIPRKEPSHQNYRNDRYEHTPPRTNSRVEVPARERHEKMQNKKHEAKARGKTRNKDDKSSDDDYRKNDRSYRRDRDDR